MAILGAVVGEFVGAQEGLGYLILQYNYQLKIAGVRNSHHSGGHRHLAAYGGQDTASSKRVLAQAGSQDRSLSSGSDGSGAAEVNVR
jgi:hypothetical protein